MQSVIVSPAELSGRDIDEMYAIHKRVYFDRGIGHPPGVWRANLLRDYHGTCGKHVLLFRANGQEEGPLNGYVICAGPLDCAGDRWAKLTEGGLTLPGDRRDIPDTFAAMLLVLVRSGPRDAPFDLNYFAEIDMHSERFTSLLLERAGFLQMRDADLARRIFSTFLGDAEYAIRQQNDILVSERKTAIKERYRGRITFVCGHDFTRTAPTARVPPG